MGVTSREVADLARVSQATVSRVLSGSPVVAESTRERVLRAANQLGYVQHAGGRNLRTRSTRQVAMVADLENRLYPSLVPALHDRLAESGYRLVLLAERAEESSLAARLLDRSIDGVVLTTTFVDSPLPATLRQGGVPFVYLTRVHDTVPADSLTVDNVAGAARVADLLVGLGHRRIGAIFSSPTTSTGRDREAGFTDRLARHGLTLDPALVAYGWYAHEFGVAGMRTLLAAPRPPTAVFCANDFVAGGALAEANRAGVRVPEDVTVVGFDDLEFASWPWLNLTTVDSPLAEMARAAASVLLDRLADPSGPFRHRVWPAPLVLRGSHGPPAG